MSVVMWKVAFWFVQFPAEPYVLHVVCIIVTFCFSWNPPGLVRCPDFGVGIWTEFCTTINVDLFGAFRLSNGLVIFAEHGLTRAPGGDR